MQTRKPMKRTGIRPRISPKLAIAKAQERAARERLWASREHVCAECGVFLPEPPIPHYFSHYIGKDLCRFIRAVDENFDLLCPPCHDRWEYRDRENMKIYNEERLQKLHDLDKKLAYER